MAINWFKLGKKKKDLVPVSPIDLVTGAFQLQSLMKPSGNFPEEKRILDYLFSQINPNLLQRNEYYRLIKGLRTNEPLFGAAVRTYLAECLTPGVNKESVLAVHSDDQKLTQHIENLIKEIGIDTQFLHDLYKTILVKGDVFIRVRKHKNKYSLELLDPLLVRYPLQFTLSEIMNDPTLNMANTILSNMPQGLLGSIGSASGLKQFIIDWYNKDGHKGICNSFDLGTVLVDGTYLAPWECLRGKDMGSEMVFFPFSECFLHNAISPALDLSQKKLLSTVTRMANIPVERWTQKERVGRRPEESDHRSQELMNKLQGSLLSQEKYDKDSGVGRRIIVPDDWEFEMLNPNLNVDNIADVEFTEKGVAIATSIPISHLLADEFTSGSGVALAKQHKPFRDKCVMFQLSGVQVITRVLEVILADSNKLLGGKTFTITAHLPPLESDNENTVTAQLDGYLGFLEKMAVIGGYSSVSDIPSELKLSVLDNFYNGKNKDAVYSVIKKSLDGKPSKPEENPVTLASVTGSSTTPSMIEMTGARTLLEESINIYRGKTSE